MDRLKRLSIKKQEREEKKKQAEELGQRYEASSASSRKSIVQDNQKYPSGPIEDDERFNKTSPYKSRRSQISGKKSNLVDENDSNKKTDTHENIEDQQVNVGLDQPYSNYSQQEEDLEQQSESPAVEEGDEQITNINNIGGMKKKGTKLKKRRSIIEQTHDLRILVNKIFAMRGGWVVKDLPMDFSDGFLFQELFNILYDEKINCHLEGCQNGPNSKTLVDSKVLNWNKINAAICFNYFQQQFYFVQGTMMALAKGKSAELTAQAIRELLIAMQGTHHNLYDDSVDVRDIADLLQINI